MATKLEKTLKREIDVDGKAYMLAISPEGLKLTEKGRRKGQELSWKGLLNGQAQGTGAQLEGLAQWSGGGADGTRLRDGGGRNGRGRVARAGGPAAMDGQWHGPYRKHPVRGARGLMVFMQTVVSSFCTPGMRRISIRSS